MSKSSKPSSGKDDGQNDSNDRGSSSSNKKNLVFLNFSNPTRDSKRTRNRKIVSKYAMLGRTRPDPGEGSSQENASTGEDQTSESQQHKFVNTSQKQAQSSGATPLQSRELIQAGRSLPALAPTVSSDKGLNDLKEADNQETEARQFGQKKLSGVAKSTAVTYTPAKKPHLSMHRPWRAIIRKSAAPAIIGPSESVGASSFDPFNVLATGSSPRINRLVHAYVNAHVITNRWYRGIPGYGEQLRNARRNLWFPLTLESKAASKALIAYLEATPERPFGPEDANGRYLSEALAETNAALRDPELATTDGTCFAVALLMLTAQRMRDTRAFQTHAHGLAALTSMRQDSPISSKYSTSIFKCFESSSNMPDYRLASIPTPDPSPAPTSKQLTPTVQDSTFNKPPTTPPSEASTANPDTPTSGKVPVWIPTSATTITGNGFHALVTAGLITPTLADFFQRAWVLHSLGENGVRWDRVALISVAEHIWVDDWPPDLAINFFEKACYAAIQICFHLVVKPSWHFCWPVEKMAGTVFEALTCADLKNLLIQCPDTLLWIIMCTGPFLKDEPLEWFSMLLRKILSKARSARFEDATRMMLTRYMWAANMNPAAERFWNTSTSQVESFEEVDTNG